jgi:hypothetical protein
MKPTLLVLAAGMGSRYGGIKQIEPVGPSGETILEYSVYDALNAGFGSIVFLIRRSIEADFSEVVLSRFPPSVQRRIAFQEIDSGLTPDQAKASSSRQKPWGTGHALLCAREAISTPFAVINADDFYGRGSFVIVHDFLSREEPTGRSYCMAGFSLESTTSPYGSVSRGICEVDSVGHLVSMAENKKIERRGALFVSIRDDGTEFDLPGDSTVSMNFFGFTPAVFPQVERSWKLFIEKNLDSPKAEFFLPTVVDEILKTGDASVSVLGTTERWFGVTYRSDHPGVVAEIRKRVDEGLYPERLWGKP